MKKAAIILLVVALLASLSACSEASPQEAEQPQVNDPVIIDFSDPYLEEGIRAAMKMPTGDITISDAEAVTALDLSNQDWDAMNAENGGIKDISDLIYFTNVTELHLDFNDIQNFSPLASMTKLTTLTFNGVRVTDLSPLKGLSNMVTLIFDWSYAPDQGHNGYENLDFISDMKQLEVLEVRGAGIKDITVLGELPKLWSVFISDNLITDISPLANVKQLKEFSIANNPITDYSSITPMREVFPNLFEEFQPDVDIE
ncbi:MAG: hypothetical protein CVU86_04085 [Firmicutes bacterium HGW-Firmicutes-11]|jgi:Leucine-rich repeat (LRR) protein|nr:MAG: hypothetical protein CVU86_04085 [Firmicutes bacterium HGW-Firmicutes-11]